MGISRYILPSHSFLLTTGNLVIIKMAITSTRQGITKREILARDFKI
jgi:hypothetical protein